MELKNILPVNGPSVDEVKKYIDKYKGLTLRGAASPASLRAAPRSSRMPRDCGLSLYRPKKGTLRQERKITDRERRQG